MIVLFVVSLFGAFGKSGLMPVPEYSETARLKFMLERL